MRLDRLDRWLGIGLAALALAWLGLAFAYIPGSRGEGEPGPRAFPILLGVLLFVLGVMLAAAGFGSARRRAAPAQEIEPPTRREAVVAAGTFGLLMLYAFLLEKAGFVAATPVVILLAMRGLLGLRAWLLNLSMAGGVTAVCWLVFVVLLETPLPRGSWWWLL